jgi:hypothetical protein
MSFSVRSWLFFKWTPRRINARIGHCIRVSVCARALWSIKLIGSLACRLHANLLGQTPPFLCLLRCRRGANKNIYSAKPRASMMVLGESVCIVLVPAAAHALTPGPHCRDIKLNLQRSLFAPGASSLSHARTLIYTRWHEREWNRCSREKQLMRRPECLICVDLIMLRRRRSGLRRLWIVRSQIAPARKLCGDDEKVWRWEGVYFLLHLNSTYHPYDMR